MSEMISIDRKKELKEFYSPSKKPQLVTVPKMKFLMYDGEGDPNKSLGKAYGALYPMAYALKFLIKKELLRNYTVMPSEGLWWAEDMAEFSPSSLNKDAWEWTLMISVPDETDDALFEAAMKKALQKKDASKEIEKVYLKSYEEGTAAQILHIGPYTEEHENIQKLHDLIESCGGSFDGHVQKHHEIYLSDPRKTAPEKLKTVIRQPYVRS